MIAAISVNDKRLFVLAGLVVCLGIGLCLRDLLLHSAVRNPAGQTTISTNVGSQRAEEQASRFGHYLLTKGVPGLEIAISKDGQIVYSRAFGFANIDNQILVTPETKFRIGSISKTLTGVAIVQLAEQGKLLLDAPIQKYLPNFPDKGVIITPRMLAGHISGIRHYQGTERTDQHHDASITDGLKIFKNDPLVGPPGAQFHYSSFGFNVLGAIIEAVSGESLNEYIQHKICRPLNLHSTMADLPSGFISDRAQGYSVQPGKPVQVMPYVDNSYKLPSGGFLSSAEDLVRFGSALLQPGFLKAHSRVLLFTPQKTTDGQSTGYGIGWCVGKSRSGRVIYWHAGDALGSSSQLIIYPQSNLVIATVANLTRAPFTLEDVEALAEAFETQVPR